MTMNESESKNVNINPGAFATESELLDLSMEDIVSLFKDKETRRHMDKETREDENQQETIIGFRALPTGLLMSLDAACRRCNISRGLLTKCLSHQIMAWYESIPRLKELSELFYTAGDTADDLGYPDLYDGMRDTSYSFARTTTRLASFRTINWIRNGLYQLAQPLGLPVSILFAVGLCQSVVTTGSGRSQGTIEKYLSEEVHKLNQHIEERFIRLYAFHETIRQRAAVEKRENRKTG